MKRLSIQRGQSLIEYSILIIIVVAVFLSMNSYFKRGIQGRWKASIDDLGEQYDPRTTNSLINYVLNSSSNTSIDVVPTSNGDFWTNRVDTSSSSESKGGQTVVGALLNKL